MDRTDIPTPLGTVTAFADSRGLTGLYFKEYMTVEIPRKLTDLSELRDDAGYFLSLRRWLADYFAGSNRPVDLPLVPEGTPFQRRVWERLRSIPYGETCTYGEIARELGKAKSAQAVGGAVGRNPLMLLIPCHRVIGSDGSLTGYAGGIERKKALLEREGALGTDG